MFKEFRDFALRGNVLDMAVGIIIGAAFTSIVNSLVNDILMPPLGWLLGGINFENFYLTLNSGSTPGPYTSLADAGAAGAVTINYGLFINAVISFTLVALAMFLLIRAINRLQAAETSQESQAEPTAKDCPFCLSSIPLQATRCPHCTSQLE
ncbi:MAG: large conductance mechanosensitive channel protein MscL [Chloroflexota bacterium]|nr:MAG: large conductance mechanosensitive channel protein MscL [Chloroflexota bacterium]